MQKELVALQPQLIIASEETDAYVKPAPQPCRHGFICFSSSFSLSFYFSFSFLFLFLLLLLLLFRVLLPSLFLLLAFNVD